MAIALRPFKACKAGCGRYGDFRGGVCDSCRHERIMSKAQAAAIAQETRRLNNRAKRGELLTARRVS